MPGTWERQKKPCGSMIDVCVCSSCDVCVRVLQIRLNHSFYPSTCSTPRVVPILHPREMPYIGDTIQKLSYDTEKLWFHRVAEKGVDNNAMPWHRRTGYDSLIERPRKQRFTAVYRTRFIFLRFLFVFFRFLSLSRYLGCWRMYVVPVVPRSTMAWHCLVCTLSTAECNV